MRILSAILFITLAATTAFAARTEYEIATLQGINQVVVSVGVAQPKINGVEVDQVRLQTSVELKLQRAGIKVAPTGSAPPTTPIVILAVDILEPSAPNLAGTVVYTVNLSVRESARLNRTPIGTSAITWSDSSFGIVGSNKLSDAIRSITDDLVDGLLNDYLKANTSPPGEPTADQATLQLGQVQPNDNPAAFWLYLSNKYPGVDVREEWRKALDAEKAEHGADNPKLVEMASKRFGERCEELKKKAEESTPAQKKQDPAPSDR